MTTKQQEVVLSREDIRMIRLGLEHIRALYKSRANRLKDQELVYQYEDRLKNIRNLRYKLTRAYNKIE